jgi:hypothetical protein
MNINNREFLIWKEQGRGVNYRERGWAGQQAGVFKVLIAMGEIKGRHRELER